MSHLKVTTPLEPSITHQKPQPCFSSGILKISLVVFGLLLIGGAIASHIYQVNTIAVYTLGGVGGFLILATVITSVVQHSKADKKAPLQERDGSDPIPTLTPSVQINQKQLSDAEIITNLQKQGYSQPIEEGGDGRCLFWSIAPQITDGDISQGLSSHYAKYLEGWGNLPLNGAGDDRLDRLRKMALAEEENFLHALPCANTETFSPAQKDWIFELYKDMIQELERLSPEGVCKSLAALASADPDPAVVFHKQFLYCKTNFPAYKLNTQQKYNWAGTSELISIGRIFKREVQAFGRDIAPTSLDQDGNVLPYYSSCAEDTSRTSPPIVVFQSGGGGHYRRLVPPTSKS